MTEYWVSRKRWTCRYCDVTINDDVPSRQLHENGLRHKSNVERSLAEAFRKSQRDRRAESDAKREMDRIEKLARESHAKDLSAVSAKELQEGRYASSSPPALPPDEKSKSKSKSAPQAWKPKDRFSAYGSALPISNATEEEEYDKRVAGEEESRRAQGEPGAWETVTHPPSPPPSTAVQPLSISQNKDGENERERMRGFRFKEKQAYLNDDSDQEDGLGEIKVRKRIRVDDAKEKMKREEEERRKLVPTWAPVQLQRSKDIKKEGLEGVPVQKTDDESGGEVVDLQGDEDESRPDKEHSAVSSSLDTPALEADQDSKAAKAVTEQIEKQEKSVGGGMFKKRKAGAGAGAKKVRAFV